MRASTKIRSIALYSLLALGKKNCITSNNGVSAVSLLLVTSFQFQSPPSTSKGHRGGRRRLQNIIGGGTGSMRYPIFNRKDYGTKIQSRTRISPSAVLLERNDNEVTSSETAQRTLPSESGDNVKSGLPQLVSQGGLRKLDIVLLASYSSSVALLSIGLQSILLQFEWAQDWRYFWPLIGILYIWDGLRVLSGDKGLQKIYKSSQNMTSPSSSVLLPGLPTLWSVWLGTMSGVGLLIGGASDAFLPVWMTGPNLISSAGVSQDAAAFLLILTAASVVRQFGSDLIPYPTQRFALPNLFGKWTFWANSILMAQLYILGAGTFDEIWLLFQDIIP